MNSLPIRWPVRCLDVSGWWSTAIVAVACLGCSDRQEGGQNMPESEQQVNPDTVRFHRLVESGSLDELRRALDDGADVNAPGHHEQTALMVAIDVKDVTKMELLLDHGADPEQTDRFNKTALRDAVAQDLVEGVRLLLSRGVDRGYQPKYPLKKVVYDFDIPDVEMPAELRDVMSEDEWQASLDSVQESMDEELEDPTVEPVIVDVESVEVLELLLAAGDTLSQAPPEIQRLYIGLGSDGEFQASLADYRRHKTPRFGVDNPERMDNPFWSDMIRLGVDAYQARLRFKDENPFDGSGPVWCFDRFGSTITPLADGRFVQIGGEHEDHYDPDFQIYNDVVVHDGAGNFEIYGYPESVFPPTDFHSATLVNDAIYVVGCLGYPEQRKPGQTPVYRLMLNSWKFEGVTTSGDAPGWLWSLRSTYDPERNVIQVDGGKIVVDDELETQPNESTFELDLSSFRWRKIE